MKQEISQSNNQTNSQSELQKYKTDDLFYNKCMKMFSDIFIESIESVDVSLAVYISSEIVKGLDDQKLLTDQKILKSKIFNLKDNNNPSLRENLYSGILSVEKFISMTPEEMKSDEMKKMEQKAYQQSLMDSQIAEIQAESTAFKCAKCGQRKCSYRQLQTRSADEPMTTFVTCVCGHRWKFC